MKARDNPFRTECLEALRFRFPQGDWEALWARLDATGGRGALVGPHGSGKTALLLELAQQLPRRGLRPRLVNAPAHPDAAFWDTVGRPGRGDALLVEGGERLSFWAWRRLLRRAREAGAVVATQHRTGRLPTLLHTRTSPALLAELVEELAPEGTGEDLAALHARSGGDLRLALLALYDRWALR